MRCKHCGRENAVGVDICPACGGKLTIVNEVAFKKVNEGTEIKLSATIAVDVDTSIDRAERSMIMILGKTDEGYSKGTGFFIKYEHRLFCLTNYHVIAEADAVCGVFPKRVDETQEKFAFKVLYVDDVNDIAVMELEIDATKVSPLPERRYLELEKANNIKVGEEIFVWGNPRHLTTILVFGRISGMGGADDPLQKGHAGANRILVNVDVTQGNSGGAVCNKSGKVIGMVTSSNDSLPGQALCNSSFAIEQAIVMYLIKNSYKK